MKISYDLMIYVSLVQEAMCEYCRIDDSKCQEPTITPTDINKKSQDEPLLLKYSTVAIGDTVNKTAEKVYFKIFHDGKDNESGVGSSTK